MRSEFFEQQVERLRRVYSAGSLNEERVKILWDRFKNEREDTFESALNHVIAESTTPALPSMSRIVDACGMFRTNQGGASSMRELVEIYGCEACRDSGWGVIGGGRRGGGIVEACSCPAGRKMNPAELLNIQNKIELGSKLGRGGLLSSFPSLPYDPNERIERE